MKEDLQGKLVEILSSIQSAAGKASDFALDQLPDIAQSYVLYGRASATALLVLSIAALAVIGVMSARAVAGNRKNLEGLPTRHERYMEDKVFGICVSTLLACILPVAILAIKLNEALLVWFAPKVWLLKEIASMLK